MIGIDGKTYLAHRLAWFYCFEEWPNMIDHIDCDPTNNRLDNLREATKAQNTYNTNKLLSTNTSGLKGAFYNKSRNHYYSQIIINGVRRYLGSFKTAKEAHEAYIKAAKESHGEYFNENTI